jgi:hypothetical protein
VSISAGAQMLTLTGFAICHFYHGFAVVVKKNAFIGRILPQPAKYNLSPPSRSVRLLNRFLVANCSSCCATAVLVRRILRTYGTVRGEHSPEPRAGRKMQEIVAGAENKNNSTIE